MPSGAARAAVRRRKPATDGRHLLPTPTIAVSPRVGRPRQGDQRAPRGSSRAAPTQGASRERAPQGPKPNARDRPCCVYVALCCEREELQSLQDLIGDGQVLSANASSSSGSAGGCRSSRGGARVVVLRCLEGRSWKKARTPTTRCAEADRRLLGRHPRAEERVVRITTADELDEYRPGAVVLPSRGSCSPLGDECGSRRRPRCPPGWCAVCPLASFCCTCAYSDLNSRLPFAKDRVRRPCVSCKRAPAFCRNRATRPPRPSPPC